jgi:hypothetical protein
MILSSPEFGPINVPDLQAALGATLAANLGEAENVTIEFKGAGLHQLRPLRGSRVSVVSSLSSRTEPSAWKSYRLHRREQLHGPYAAGRDGEDSGTAVSERFTP